MKIGIFDSGLGGLTIFKSIHERLPVYDYIYLGDNARTPYGNRSFEAIYKFTTESVQFLFSQDCYLIIIACNTASAKALRNIQQKILPVTYPTRRVLGVIRPSVEELGRYTQTKTVALWATEGTVKSMSFEIELKKLAPEILLIQQACPLLVPLVEAGEFDGVGARHFVEKYWRATKARSAQIDTLLLACTHYPLLLPVIKASLPDSVKILVQGDFVTPSLQDYLHRHPEIDEKLTRHGTTKFLTTDQSEGFDRLAQVFLGYCVKSERVEL
ncbi:MAG TPA: glutamate racemase [Acidobacteriota bacterium]